MADMKLDLEELATVVLRTCDAKGLMVCTVESCTGGLVAAALTEIAGSSSVFERGFSTYSNHAKMEMVNVSKDTLIAHGAVSVETAREMAAGGLAASRADLSVAITGIAGPGGAGDKPEGLVCFAAASKKGDVLVAREEFGAVGRSEVRALSVEKALQMLLDLAQR